MTHVQNILDIIKGIDPRINYSGLRFFASMGPSYRNKLIDYYQTMYGRADGPKDKHNGDRKKYNSTYAKCSSVIYLSNQGYLEFNSNKVNAAEIKRGTFFTSNLKSPIKSLTQIIRDCNPEEGLILPRLVPLIGSDESKSIISLTTEYRELFPKKANLIYPIILIYDKTKLLPCAYQRLALPNNLTERKKCLRGIIVSEL